MEEVELDDVDKTLLEEKEEVQEESEKEDAENMLEMKELTGEKANDDILSWNNRYIQN